MSKLCSWKNSLQSKISFKRCEKIRLVKKKKKIFLRYPKDLLENEKYFYNFKNQENLTLYANDLSECL